MEVIKFDKVLSVNNETQNHEAKLLLQSDVSVGKSWLCGKGTEKAVVIVKMERAAVLTKVDIGNANSAFIEVLVGRATDSDQFQTLIPTSTFMTPNESKAGLNQNHVRFFTATDFDPGAVGKPWDLLKLVCSQPFDKKVPYGLCFVKVHGETAGGSAPAIKKADEPAIAVGSFFRRRKEIGNESEKILSISERIREAEKPSELAKHTPLSASKVSSKLAEKQSSTSKEKHKRKDEERGPDNRHNRDLGLDEPSPKKSRKDEEESSTRKDKESSRRDRDASSSRKDPESSSSKKNRESSSTRKYASSSRRDREDMTPRRDTPRKEDHKGRHKDKEERKRGGTSPKRKQDDEEEEKRRQEKRRKREREEKLQKLADQERAAKKARKESDDESLRKKVEGEKRRRQDGDKEDGRKEAKARRKRKPFNRLLEDVVFVLSGYQNPERADYRAHALALGATYSQDWHDGRCTHLIAAYINTPKSNQVKGKGKIVSKDWVEKCFKDRKRYPWRRFALDKTERRQPESEEEMDEETSTPPRPSTSTSSHSSRKRSQSRDDQGKGSGNEASSGYDNPTDEEDEVSSVPTLPDFFGGQSFHVDESIADRAVLERYIIAYNGILCETLNEDVDYFVTLQRGSVLQLLSNQGTKFKAVSPTWIQAVNCSNKLIPAANFCVD